MFAAETWSCADRVLCVRLDAAGDVLLTIPAFRALVDAYPGRRLTLLASPAGAAVGRLIAEIDDVIPYEAPWIKGSPNRFDSRAEYVLVDRLRGRSFSGAAIFTSSGQNPLPAAMLCYLADIPLRLAQCRENPYHLLTHWVPQETPRGKPTHEVRRQLDLVASVGCRTENEKLTLHVPEGAKRHVKRLLDAGGIDLERPWVLFYPGGSLVSHRYSSEGFARAARTLALEDAVQLVFAGIEPEKKLVESIQAAVGVSSCSLAGKLNLSEVAALVSLAPVLVTNNTGPVGFAAAVGTPVVDVYPSGKPQHPPWGVPHRVLAPDEATEASRDDEQDDRLPIPPGALVRAVRELNEEMNPVARRLLPRVAALRVEMPEVAGS